MRFRRYVNKLGNFGKIFQFVEQPLDGGPRNMGPILRRARIHPKAQ